MKNNIRKNKGITLVALVITVIVMLILVAVTINFVIDENGIINRAKQARDSTIAAQKSEEDFYGEVDSYAEDIVDPVEGYDTVAKVNKPKLDRGMIPVYYDETEKVWKKADENNKNKQWYDYSSSSKKWANIVTVADTDSNLRNVSVGTTIPMDKITTFFVWIPRYAYSIYEGYQMGDTQNGKIDITFIKGNTNKGTDGKIYPTDYDETQLRAGAVTPKIVHPGFTFGNGELTGIWVAKFEASKTTDFITVKPSVTSWRTSTIGESQYQSMRMSENTSQYGWSNLVDSHLIKNSEWGAVAYLCYSDYGVVPQINACSRFITGAGPIADGNEGYNNSTFTETTNGYNTTLGMLASTTGNVYGIYDMNGGHWERVAGYLDNGHDNLNIYGKNNNESVKYFENNVLNTQYSKYWDKYEKGDSDSESANFVLMAKYKGIGMNEIRASNGGNKWNGDYNAVVYGACPFVVRGGAYAHRAYAGVMYSNIVYGDASDTNGFRPTLGF